MRARDKYRDEWLIRKTRASTCWRQKEAAPDCLVWVCKQCDFTTQFECDGPKENGINYCPQCGRRIMEFVPYKEDEDDED